MHGLPELEPATMPVRGNQGPENYRAFDVRFEPAACLCFTARAGANFHKDSLPIAGIQATRSLNLDS
jgi:hypothetical protein